MSVVVVAREARPEAFARLVLLESAGSVKPTDSVSSR
jgi:hypothetical protein